MSDHPTNPQAPFPPGRKKANDQREAGVNPRVERDIQSPVEGNREVSWTPPSVLPDPDPHAHPGYVHRWVRVETYGTTDPKNYTARMREGWEPCRPEDYSEITSTMMPNNPRATTPGRNPHQYLSDTIVIGGLMLCRMPVETAKARAKYYRDLSERQLEAVNQNLMRNEHPSMPLNQEVRSRTSFGKGSARDE